MTEPEYHNQTGEVPVGETYESVTVEEGTVHVGDIAVWSDPDCQYHNEDVLESIFVGRVETIYRRDEPELGLSCPIGRVAIGQHMKALSGEEIYLDRDGSSIDFVDRLLHSQYEKYMNVQWTRNGDFKVSGEYRIEPGDIYETAWGDIKIIEVDGDEYLINDPESNEQVWLDHQDLIEIMVGKVYSTN